MAKPALTKEKWLKSLPLMAKPVLTFNLQMFM